MLFRFDADDHEYTDLETGEVRPHITAMLARTGYIDDRWYTEESSERGTMIHTLTARYDLGALDLSRLLSAWRPFVLAHQKAMLALRPTWTAIEIPLMHPVYRFGGRPDRGGLALRLHTVLEVKSGQRERAHEIQTALQAILLAGQGGLPAEHYQRLALYLKKNGRFDLQQHKERRDFDVAHEIIRATCT